MLIWSLIIFVLSGLLIYGTYVGLSSEFSLLIAYLALISAIGVLYRIFKKMKEGEMEELENKIQDLSRENEELRLICQLEDSEEEK